MDLQRARSAQNSARKERDLRSSSRDSLRQGRDRAERDREARIYKQAEWQYVGAILIGFGLLGLGLYFADLAETFRSSVAEVTWVGWAGLIVGLVSFAYGLAVVWLRENRYFRVIHLPVILLVFVLLFVGIIVLGVVVLLVSLAVVAPILAMALVVGFVVRLCLQLFRALHKIF